MTAAAAAPGQLASALYVGRVRHRRFEPRGHSFGYRLFMLYLDLAELDEVFASRWLWSRERFNLASFRRRDYLGDPAVPLDTAVRDRAQEVLERRPSGPIRMLTHIRYHGYVFNPVTFYYCFQDDGRTLDCLVAEITNTPWGERHSYVLDARAPTTERPDRHRWVFDKVFHVSPFMGMDHVYDWVFTTPADTLAVHMENRRDGTPWFDATLTLERRELTGRAMALTLLRHPFMTGKAILGIYWQALRLWWKRIPFHSHPKYRSAAKGA